MYYSVMGRVLLLSMMMVLFGCEKATKQKGIVETVIENALKDSVEYNIPKESLTITQEYSIRIGNDRSKIIIEGKDGVYKLKLVIKKDTALEKTFTIDSLLYPNLYTHFNDSLSIDDLDGYEIDSLKYYCVRANHLYFYATLKKSDNERLSCSWISLCYRTHRKREFHTTFSKLTQIREYPVRKVESKNSEGKLTSIKNYHFEKLNGYWYEDEGIQKDGQYLDGKREGVFRDYYGDKTHENVMLMSYYKNDSVLWYAHPASDQKYYVPSVRGKGFKCVVDSVYIKAPYMNGVIWYEGLFIQNEPKGVHKVRDKCGQLKSVLNYESNKVKTYNYDGTETSHKFSLD